MKCLQPACFGLLQALVAWASRWLPPSWHGYYGFCKDRSLCVGRWISQMALHLIASCKLEELLFVLTSTFICLLFAKRIPRNSRHATRIDRPRIKCIAVIAEIRMFLGCVFEFYEMKIRSDSTCSAATATSCHFFTHRYAKATEGLKDRLIWHGSWPGTDDCPMDSCCFFISLPDNDGMVIISWRMWHISYIMLHPPISFVLKCPFVKLLPYCVL